MTRQEFKEKIVNHIVFRLKVSSRSAIEALKGVDFDTLMLNYIDTLPEPTSLQECHNQLIWIRKYALPLQRLYRGYKRRFNEVEEDYKKFLQKTGAETIADLDKEQYELYETIIKLSKHVGNLWDMLEKMIVRFNLRIEAICDMYDKADLPFHTFCQVIGINPTIAKLNMDTYQDMIEDRKHFHLIFFGVEDSREEEGWKSNRNGMPMFHLMQENFLILLHKDKKVKEQVDDYIMHDMGLASAMVTIKEDKNGNKVVEKYYPPLKLL